LASVGSTEVARAAARALARAASAAGATGAGGACEGAVAATESTASSYDWVYEVFSWVGLDDLLGRYDQAELGADDFPFFIARLDLLLDAGEGIDAATEGVVGGGGGLGAGVDVAGTVLGE